MRGDAAAVLHDQSAGAVEITYKQTPIVCRVIYGRRRDRDRRDKTMARVCWLRLLKTDVPDPRYGDQVIIGAQKWLVAEVEQETGWDWRLRLETSRRQGWR